MIRQEGNLWYNACKTCNKKVVQSTDGWNCDNCKVETNGYVPRYILPFSAADQTGSQWLSCFNDIGEKIMHHPASTLEQYKGQPEWHSIFYDATHKQYRFIIKAKEEMYQEQWKLKCTVVQANPIDFATESTLLIQQIMNMH